MKSNKNIEKVTVQSLNNSVPAAIGGEQTGPESSSSSNCTKTISEVGNLASVIDKTPRRIEEGESVPRVSIMHPQPQKTGEEPDTSDSTENANTTVLGKEDTVEVDKMVEEVRASIAKLTTKRTKKSGAQQRKAARIKKMMEKKETQRDVPKGGVSSTPISTEKGKRNRSPEEQNTAGISKKKKGSPRVRDSATGGSHLPKDKSHDHQEGDENVPKASTSKQALALAKSAGNGGDSKKRNLVSRKRKPDEQPTYARVAKKKMTEELCYAVIDSNCASGKIPVAHQKDVEDAINERIVQYVLEADDNAPQIHIESCRFAREVLFLQLETATCVEILKDLVGGITTPWEGGKLTVVNKADIPSLTKTSVFIKGWGSKMETTAIMKIIGKQNRGLDISKWEVFHREEADDGTLIVVGLDKTSMSYLEERKGKAYFASTAIFFKVGKTPIGWTPKPTENKDSKDEANKETCAKDRPLPMREEESEITPSQEESLLAENK